MGDNDEYEHASRSYTVSELKDLRRLKEIKHEFACDKVVPLGTWRKLCEFEQKAKAAQMAQGNDIA